MKRKSRSRDLKRQVLQKLSESLFKGILASLGLLEYVVTIRETIKFYYGLYWMGLADGAIIVATLIVAVVYMYMNSY